MSHENIGARRLLNVIEKIIENIGFLGPDSPIKDYEINKDYITKELKDHFAKIDLKRYML